LKIKMPVCEFANKNILRNFKYKLIEISKDITVVIALTKH